MKKLCIIPCGKKKIWDNGKSFGPIRAREAYIGTFHRLCKQYADIFADRWVVLSAKHGFLDADDLVPGPYDLSFHHKSKEIVSSEKLQEQVWQKGLGSYDQIAVLAGRKYRPIVAGSFKHDSIEIVFPLTGLRGIGEMQQKLKQAVDNGTPLL